MTKTILIDAAHKEETRVAVLENNILQDFDREALAVQQIKGNIYLAKITRVEQSLQAAFVDYGADRHGFLPFSDIHPDYFKLSDAEKKKIKDLTKESAQKKASEEELEDDGSSSSSSKAHSKDKDGDSNSITIGSYSVEDEAGSNRSSDNLHKRYNIQDVIKPNQVVLVQVLKEERGNKGAALTTFISIAGKYCVLMANTANKGGVSKKVDNFRDRKILRDILSELEVPEEKSVIIRTAGVGKRPEEIKRDYDYLVRLWNSIRETTLSSSAPTFIHAEDDVIKRCIRDVYSEDVKSLIIEGKDAHATVVDFVKFTMSQSKSADVQLYEEKVPIFNRYKVEQQITSLYDKEVKLPSGGSIVIDHTEALVAVDVNSGRATKESGIEETAYKTNLEAAVEVARQLRLRDMAGLIVIDFIDMYDQKNRRTVERTLRDALQNDRARIQLGRISIFGLMEMSRQRLGSSFFETITDPCQHCNGTGFTRSVEIVAVSILRAIRHACIDKNVGAVHIDTSGEVISYILNFKRRDILLTEKNYNVHIFMHNDDSIGGVGFTIKKKKALSVDEKRELDMEVHTGKVNKLGIERNFLDELNDEIDTDSPSANSQNTSVNKRYKGKNPRYKGKNPRRGGPTNNKGPANSKRPGEKKSLLSSIFAKMKR